MKKVFWALSVLALFTNLAFAQSTLYWNTTTNGASMGGINWYNSTTLSASGPSAVGTPTILTTYDYLVFDNPSGNANAKAAATSLVSGGTSFGVGSLTFNNNFNGTNSTTIANATASNVFLRFATGWNITNNASSGTVTFTKTGAGNFTLALINDGGIYANSGATLVFDSNIVIANQSGTLTGSITKSGSGTLTMSGTNTFGGSGKSFTLSAGTLNINNAAALGSASNTFIISGGMINNTSGSSITTSNYAQNWNGNFTFTGSNALNLGTGAVTLSANRQVTVSASTLTVGGAIGGVGHGLTKTGNGTLIITGNSTYTGGTTVTTGTLNVGATNALLAATGTVSVNGGTFATSVSSATLGGGVNLSSGGLNLNGTSTGNLTLGAASNFVMSGGTLTLSLNSSSSFDQIIGTGGLGIFTLTGGTINFDTSGGAINYTSSYQVFTNFGASSSVTAINYTGITGYTANLSNAGLLTFTANAIPEPSTYAVIFGEWL